MSQHIISTETPRGIIWYCSCGQSIESTGTDASSRNAVRAFKTRHWHKEKEKDE